jgi:hypothetical protein
MLPRFLATGRYERSSMIAVTMVDYIRTRPHCLGKELQSKGALQSLGRYGAADAGLPASECEWRDPAQIADRPNHCSMRSAGLLRQNPASGLDVNIGIFQNWGGAA